MATENEKALGWYVVKLKSGNHVLVQVIKFMAILYSVVSDPTVGTGISIKPEDLNGEWTLYADEQTAILAYAAIYQGIRGKLEEHYFKPRKSAERHFAELVAASEKRQQEEEDGDSIGG